MDEEHNGRTVSVTQVGLWLVSTMLLTDGSAFETKVFGPEQGPDGRAVESDCGHEYEIRVGHREQSAMNHWEACEKLRRGRLLVLPPHGPDTGFRIGTEGGERRWIRTPGLPPGRSEGRGQ